MGRKKLFEFENDLVAFELEIVGETVALEADGVQALDNAFLVLGKKI